MIKILFLNIDLDLVIYDLLMIITPSSIIYIVKEIQIIINMKSRFKYLFKILKKPLIKALTRYLSNSALYWN